jgi:small subunit ribosomal protein S16
MPVVIRLSRIGRRNRPSYRICVADSRYPLDGRVLEHVGSYDPMAPRADMRMKIATERVQHWLGHGARMSDTVRSIYNKLGGAKLAPPAPVLPRDRSGRKKKTARRSSRESAQQQRAQAKLERAKARVAARKAKAKEPAEAAS